MTWRLTSPAQLVLELRKLRIRVCQPPKHVQKAARRIADPDARVLAMLGARGADSSSETAPKPMRRGKGVAKLSRPISKS